MRKNITSLILAFFMVMSIFTFSATAEKAATSTQEKSIEFVKTFNIIKPDDNGNFNENNTVTRGELAQIICSVFNLTMNRGADWYEQIFQESNAHVSLDEVTSETQLFSDLKNTHEYYSYIKTACGLGILQGNEKNEFLPDRNVTYEQFNKVMVGILGYSVKAEAKGGYPYGYDAVARELKLTSNIKSSGSKEITRKDMAIMIFNAMDVEVMYVSSINNDGYKYEPKNGETFLDVMGLKRVTGQITANDITDLYGSQNLNINSVRIGNEIFNLSEDTSDLGNYIGREVEVYSTKDENLTYQTVLLYFLTGKDNALTINVEDFKNYSDNTVTYEENDTNKVIKVKSGAKMIKNGSVETVYDNNTFLYDCGTITFVSTNNTKVYDFIILNGYDSVYVSQWNKEDNIMHDKFKGTAVAYDFKNYEEEKIQVFKNNEAVTLDDIAIGNVIDVCAGANSVRIYISDNKVANFTIKSIENSNGTTVYNDGESSYKVSKDFDLFPDRKQELVGCVGTLYLNKFNQVVWFEEGEDGSKNLAYLKASKPGNGLDETIAVQIYDYNSAKILELPLHSKVSLDTQNGTNVKKLAKDIYNDHIRNYKGVIKYELNKDGEIIYIELPINVAGVKGEEGRLYDLGAIKNLTLTNQTLFSTYIGYDAPLFVNSTNTIGIKIPNDQSNENDEDYYGCGKIFSVFSTQSNYDFEAYTTDPGTIFADIVVAKGGAGSTRISEYKNFAVVKDITTVYKDESKAKKITLTTVPTVDANVLNDFVVYAKEDGGINKAGQKCYYSDCVTDIITSTDASGNVREYSLAKGDIIYYSVDQYNYLNAAPIVIYKADMNNPYVAPSNWGKKGWFAGTEAVWANNNIENGNPLVWDGSSVLTWAAGSSYSAGCYRIAFGCPVWYKNRTYKLTTQDLTNGSAFSESTANTIYRTRDYFYSSAGCTINIKNDKVEVKKVSPEDIKTYEYYGKDCSQIINMINYGNFKTTIVINRD